VACHRLEAWIYANYRKQLDNS